MKTIILAGGVGTRLWPLSREYFPKQFIPMEGNSLFQKTCERAAKLSREDEIWVVTNEIHQYLVRNQMDDLGYSIPDDHVLSEPEGKNTLPAIAWAMQRIKKEDKNATAVVFPSDHLLGDVAIDQIKAAEPLAHDYLVTFGVKPASPHTGYGYIKPGKALALGSIVDQFKEKPDEKTATEYVKKGYLWNSGIFLFPSRYFLRNSKNTSPASLPRLAVPKSRITRNWIRSRSITACWNRQRKWPSCRSIRTGTISGHLRRSTRFTRTMRKETWGRPSTFRQRTTTCMRRANAWG